MSHRILLMVPLVLVLVLTQVQAAEPPPPVGSRVTEFTLPEPATGKNWSLGEQTRNAKAIVVLFTSTSCPVCTSYTPRLEELANLHGEKVAWVAIASHPADDADSVAKYQRESNYPFPILKDENSTLASRLKIERVPTVLVLDAGRAIRYFGRIDDQFSPGVHKAKAATAELADAIGAVLKGEAVVTAHAPAAGCRITGSSAVTTTGEPVTYHGNVASIIQAKCQECHRPGEAGPFPLMTYQHAKSWSAMMREVVAEDVMPPWHAVSAHGHFQNDRRLTKAEKASLLAWIDQACPEGDPKLSPPPRKFTDGWRLRRLPDEVLRMKDAVYVPATGKLPYQYQMVGEPFPTDRWVTAVEVRPEHRSVVHHIIAFVLPPGSTMLDLVGPRFGRYMLGAYVPGDQPIESIPGLAKRVVKGSRIVFEIHYTPNGKAVKDRSMIGLCYAAEPPEAEIHSISVMNNKFRIPPEDSSHEVKSKHRFDRSATLISLTPHMHVRGKAFRYDLVYPDGKREMILNVPKYDFNWQASYTFATMPTVPAGTVLECTAWYDNSSKNPFNPNPKKTIGWGNMTTDEMMIGFVMYHDAK
jgi:peroxiredoxin